MRQPNFFLFKANPIPFIINIILNFITSIMADEEGTLPFQFTPENGKTGNNSRDYTGRGLSQYPNGDTYEGEYVDGVRNGKGKYIFSNGDRFEGEFKNNKKHGIGKIVYKQKGEYYGQWENGLKHGEGTYTYANKDIYSGWWQFGKKHGKGNYIYGDTGMRLTGNWTENKIVNGRWIFPNGTYFQGQFQNNKPSKIGTWYFPDGNKLQGTYIQTIIPNEDPDDKKINLKLEWASDSKLYESASLVNSHENF